MAKQRIVYRDSKTGRFARKSQWKRNRKRYKRERIKKRKRVAPPPPPPPREEVHEFLVSFTYDKSGRSFDVIVTATSEEEARAVAKGFLASDSKGQNITQARFKGWSQVVAKGKRSDLEAGEAEYREDSEE